MIVEGLLHFVFTYVFHGQEEYVHQMDVFARDAEDAKWSFSTKMVNAPKYEILSIVVKEQE